MVGNEFEVKSNSNEFSICFLHQQQRTCSRRRIEDKGNDSICIYPFVLRHEEFKGEDDGDGASAELSLLGSHSIRKYAASFAQRCGVTKDKKDIRG